MKQKTKKQKQKQKQKQKIKCAHPNLSLNTIGVDLLSAGLAFICQSLEMKGLKHE